MTSNGGTIPPNMALTTLKPDIVIVDDKNKTVDIFELTVPFEGNIKKRNLEKSNKYAHFVSDIKTYKATVIAFEVGSRQCKKPRKIIHLLPEENQKKEILGKHIHHK